MKCLNLYICSFFCLLILPVSVFGQNAPPENRVPLRRPAAYVDIIPVLIAFQPKSPKIGQLYYEHRLKNRLTFFGQVLFSLTEGAEVPNSDNTFDLKSVGIGVGPRYYFWESKNGKHGIFGQTNINFGPAKFREQSPSGDIRETKDGNWIVSVWVPVGYKFASRRFAFFIQGGLDQFLTDTQPEQGKFSQELLDLFKIDRGTKPTFSFAVGYAF
ncbi:hypothetical protein HYR99_29965 [Candidatus Poribacteria bacterium]|nr:hypothetical protein [Candidatus Poribacteria bacterium]